MERWCPVVLLVLCSVVLTMKGVDADDTKFDNDCCTYFYRLDFDGDLRVTPKDLQEFNERVLCSGLDITAEGFRRKAEQLAALADQAPRFFNIFNVSLVDAIRTNGVSLDEFRKSMKARRFTDGLKEEIGNTVTFIRKIFNEDGNDTTLSFNEFETDLSVFGLSPTNARTGFDQLDFNKDGFISLEEGNTVAMEYFNQAANPNNFWAGIPFLTCDEVANRKTSA